MNGMHIQGMQSKINYGNDDDFMNYDLHLVNNNDKSAKFGLHQ